MMHELQSLWSGGLVRRAALVVLLIASAIAVNPVSLVAQEQSEADVLPLADEDRNWRVGYLRLAELNLRAEDSFLVDTYFLLLTEYLSLTDTHRLNEAEISARARNLLRDAVKAQEDALTTLVSRRDEQLFQPEPDSEARARIDTQVEESRTALQRLRVATAEDVLVPQVKPLEHVVLQEQLVSPESGSQQAGQIERLADANNLDYLLYGSVESVSGYLFVDVRIVHTADFSEVFRHTNAGLPAAGATLAEESAAELSEIMLGRPWARLVVETENPDAEIYVDGELIGVGQGRSGYLEPGEVELRVGERGVPPQIIELELEAGTVRNLSVPDAVFSEEEVTIRTDPDGALVLVGSRPVGRTPVPITRPGVDLPVQVIRDGYLDARATIGPLSPEELFVDMISDDVSPQLLLRTRRDEFYNSFARFSLSLALPIVFGGVYQHYFALFQSEGGAPGLSTETQRELARIANGFYYATLASQALSAGLFVDMMFRIGRYIGAAQLEHER